MTDKLYGFSFCVTLSIVAAAFSTTSVSPFASSSIASCLATAGRRRERNHRDGGDRRKTGEQPAFERHGSDRRNRDEHRDARELAQLVDPVERDIELFSGEHQHNRRSERKQNAHQQQTDAIRRGW